MAWLILKHHPYKGKKLPRVARKGKKVVRFHLKTHPLTKLQRARALALRRRQLAARAAAARLVLAHRRGHHLVVEHSYHPVYDALGRRLHHVIRRRIKRVHHIFA